MRVIQPAMLERMARIALELPGHRVSVDSAEGSLEEEEAAADMTPPPDSGVVLRIDGVVAEELIDRLSG